MPQAKALKAFRYAARSYAPGDPVEVRSADTKIMVALGRVELIDPNKPRRGRPPKVKPDPEPAGAAAPPPEEPKAPAPEPEASDDADGSRRAYRRRDMRAED